MQQVFVNPEQVTDHLVTITGDDANHLGKAIRIKPGEVIRVSVSGSGDYFAEVESVSKDAVTAHITGEAPNTELSTPIYLFQGIPKGDRMETVIEKAVELGVYEIIPVDMKYCVVKLDEKKKKNKIRRWQTIAETAARQSKRSLIPEVKDVMTFKEAVAYANNCDVRLVPYENERGMPATREALEKIMPGKSVSMIIGPEGGFAEDEINLARETMSVISLGSRILRTDTAAISTMTLVMMQSELAENEK